MGAPGWYESSWDLQQGLWVNEGPWWDELSQPDAVTAHAVIPAKAGTHADSEPPPQGGPGFRRDDREVQPSPGGCPVPPSAT